MRYKNCKDHPEKRGSLECLECRVKIQSLNPIVSNLIKPKKINDVKQKEKRI